MAGVLDTGDLDIHTGVLELNDGRMDNGGISIHHSIPDTHWRIEHWRAGRWQVGHWRDGSWTPADWSRVLVNGVLGAGLMNTVGLELEAGRLDTGEMGHWPA